ncbi:MAG: NADPH-dependent F420 reductase [Myxococcota bacterium]
MRGSIGVIGSGMVGQTLAAGLARHGYAVTIGSRTPEKLADWQRKEAPQVRLATTEEAARAGDVVIVAVAGGAAEETVRSVADALAGKVVIDTGNPISGPPVNGVIPYFTGPNDSLMERLQKAVPAARFVKAFCSVGAGFMIDPKLPGGPPTMFICGNDAGAKATVSEILTEVGWEPYDVGGVEAARAVEPLAVLWCAPGFLRGDWAHAFKMLKP